MNLRDLEYLVAMHQLKHFGKAAESCFVSQPTLSGQLKKLQEELGLELIEKSNRKVVFTEAGEKMVVQAELVLKQTKELELVAQSLKDPLAGRLIMGAIPTVGPYFYPLVLKIWREKFPRVEFELHELKTEEIVRKLQSGEIDLGILALPLDISQLKEIPLYEESFQLAIHADQPIPKRIQPEWIEDKNLMLLTDGHCFRDQALQYCSINNSQLKSRFQATSLETLRSMVALGEGLTLVPELTGKQWSGTAMDQDIRYVDFETPTPVRQVGFIYRKGTRQEDLFEALGKVASKKVKSTLKSRKLKKVIPVV